MSQQKIQKITEALEKLTGKKVVLEAAGKIQLNGQWYTITGQSTYDDVMGIVHDVRKEWGVDSDVYVALMDTVAGYVPESPSSPGYKIGDNAAKHIVDTLAEYDMLEEAEGDQLTMDFPSDEEEPATSNGEHTYVFAFPVGVECTVNEQDIYDWQEFVREMDQEYGTNVESEIEGYMKSNDEGDEEEVDFDTAVERYMQDQYKGQYWKAYQDLWGGKMELQDASNADELGEALMTEYNEAQLEQYIDGDRAPKNAKVISMRIVGFDKSKALMEVKTDGVLSDEDVENIADYIEGQNSDGAGENFEQQDFKGPTQWTNCSVHTWWRDDENNFYGGDSTPRLVSKN